MGSGNPAGAMTDKARYLMDLNGWLHLRGALDDAQIKERIAGLQRLPELMRGVLKQKENVLQMSKVFRYASNFLYLGRGVNFPVALEGALKLKEISYIHAEGYPAAEMKHGPIALIDPFMPVVIIAPRASTSSMFDSIFSNTPSCGATATTGMFSSIRAIGPCFISPAG